MIIIILAAVLYYVLFYLLLQTKKEKEQDSTVQALIFSLCGITLYLYTITEVLSQFRTLHFSGVLWCWIGLIAVGFLGIALVAYRSKANGNSGVVLRSVGLCRITAGKLCAVIFGMAVLALSIYTVTHNWDSMRYHLPRIMSWAQNKSVAHYFTNDVRRLSSPPLAEFFNLHEYLLTHSDRLFHLLQACAYLINGYFVYKIAALLRLEKNWRIVAVLLYFSMPIAFAEAFTTQVDNFATLWLLIFVYECVKLAACERITDESLLYVKLVCIGLSGAFGYLTKPSVCIAMAVFAIGLAVVRIARRDKVSVLSLSFGVTVVPAALTVLPELLRNFATFNAYASSSTGAKQLVGTLNPAYVFINFLKNLGFNLPNVYFRGLPDLIQKVIRKFSALFNVQMNHESISEAGAPYTFSQIPDYGHDTATNPIIVWLFLIATALAIVLVIRKRKHQRDKTQKGNLYYLICSFLSFMGLMAVLRWERFETRYEIGFLALLCPYIAYLLYRVFQNRQGLKNGVIAIVAAACVLSCADQAYFHADVARKQDGQLAGYFTNNAPQCSTYRELIDEINAKNYKTVGLYITRGQYSYPFWPMCPGVERIEDVAGGGYNETQKYDDLSFVPDCIVWIADLPESGEFEWHGVTYQKSYEINQCYLLTRCAS